MLDPLMALSTQEYHVHSCAAPNVSSRQGDYTDASMRSTHGFTIMPRACTSAPNLLYIYTYIRPFVASFPPSSCICVVRQNLRMEIHASSYQMEEVYGWEVCWG